jgi:serine/threonine protein kinase
VTFRNGSTYSEIQSPTAQNRATFEKIVADWRGTSADAQSAFDANPDLAADRSLAVELAYIAFQRRRDAGEQLDPGDYCKGFPSFGDSLLRILEVDQYLSSNQDLGIDKEDFDWPLPGDCIGDFTLLKELGRGAFSRVFLARENSLGDRLVALKVSLMDEDEAQTLGRLHHPHIVPVYSVTSDLDGRFVLLCMPFCGELTLADCLHLATTSQKPMSGRVFIASSKAQRLSATAAAPPSWKPEAEYFNAVLKIGIALAEALEHAHARGILHLDLKPSNVLLADDGCPLLLDFNLAQDSRALQRRLGGTLPYMAPEVLARLPDVSAATAGLDVRADVFGLGVLLYQLATLQLPFPVTRLDLPFAELCEKQRGRIAQGPSGWDAAAGPLDRRFIKTVESCLNSNPNQRPASASQVAASLRRCLAPDAKIERHIRRNRRAWRSSMFVAGAMLVALLTYVVSRPPRHEREFALGVQLLEKGDLVTAISHFDHAIATSPDHLDSLIARAQALHRTGDDRSALASVLSANRLNPTGRGLSLACYLACRTGQFGEAVASGQQYLERFSEEPGVLNNLGFALSNHGRILEGIAVLTRVCEKYPTHVQAFYNRGSIELRRMQKLDDGAVPPGVDDLRKVVAAEPKSGEPYFRLAVLLVRSRPWTPALGKEVRWLLKQCISFGTNPKLVRDFAPMIPDFSSDELETLLTTPVLSSVGNFEHLVATF